MNARRMFRSLWMNLALLSGLALSAPAFADYWFQVPDSSQLKYVVGNDSKVYLRNLNQFDSTVLGCCYNYWIDLSTAAGRAQWATLLAKIQSGQEVWIFVTSQTAQGTVYLGDL